MAAVAAHVDPVEKKPLHHFLPGSDIFSIGTVGCNLRCAWCQNWDISQFRDFDPETDALGRRLMPQEIVDLCLRQGIPLVAFTYNEPAIYFEYAYDTAKLAHEAGLRTVMVSSGYETLQAIETIAPSFGCDQRRPESLRQRDLPALLRRTVGTGAAQYPPSGDGKRRGVEVTTLVIPRLNDGDEELRHRRVLGRRQPLDIPWHVSGFVPHYHMQDRPLPRRRCTAPGRSARERGCATCIPATYGAAPCWRTARYAVPCVRDADPAMGMLYAPCGRRRASVTGAAPPLPACGSRRLHRSDGDEAGKGYA